MQIDWWLQPRAVFGHTFNGIIWHMPQKWSQFNCMTLSWWPCHKIVSVTFTKLFKTRTVSQQQWGTMADPGNLVGGDFLGGWFLGHESWCLFLLSISIYVAYLRNNKNIKIINFLTPKGAIAPYGSATGVQHQKSEDGSPQEKSPGIEEGVQLVFIAPHLPGSMDPDFSHQVLN